MVKNNYDAVLGFSNGAFFIKNLDFSSKSKYVMVNSKGKAVNVKNTIGFDKVYTINTRGMVESSNPNYMSGYNNACCVVVGKGKKYAAILSSGKYLENGKLFDSIPAVTGFITAISGKKTFIYDESGKKLLTINSNSVGYCIDFDYSSNNALMSCSGSVLHINGKGKTVSTFDEQMSGFFTKMYGEKCIRCFWPLSGTKYFSLNGKEISGGKDSFTLSGTSLSGSIKRSRKNFMTLTIKDKKGKTIYTSNNPNGRESDAENIDSYVAVNNGKLIISYGYFAVIDIKTGKKDFEIKDGDFGGIKGICTDNSSFLAQRRSGIFLVDKKGKIISVHNKYGDVFEVRDIIPVEKSDNNIYELGTSFIIYSANYRQGLIDSKGMIIAFPNNDNINSYASFEFNGKKCTVSDLTTGKKLMSNISRAFDNYYYVNMTTSASYILTKSDSGKYGCIVVKVA